MEWIEKIKSLKNIEKLDKKLINELIEDIVIDNNSNIKLYLNALNFK